MTRYFRRRAASLTETLTAGAAAAAVAGMVFYVLRTMMARESFDSRPPRPAVQTPDSEDPSSRDG